MDNHPSNQYSGGKKNVASDKIDNDEGNDGKIFEKGLHSVTVGAVSV